MTQFEVGKTYETTVVDFFADCDLTKVGQRFTCHSVDEEGHCWSRDTTWVGMNGLWCVALKWHLLDGLVVEVQP